MGDGHWWSHQGKERVGKWGKKGRAGGDVGRKTSASAQGLRMNLGRTVAVHCFPGCDSGELVLLGFWHYMLEMEEAWKRQRNGSNDSTGFIVWEVTLQRGTPEREPPSCLQTWSRYSGAVLRGNCAGWENSSRVELSIARRS
jgi:hypothetical protein